MSTTSQDDTLIDDVIKRLSLSNICEDKERNEDDDLQVPTSPSQDKILNGKAAPQESRGVNNQSTSFSKRSTSDSTENGSKGKSSVKNPESKNAIKRLLSEGSKIGKSQKDKISVEHLPQRFVVKYLGSRSCPKLFGLKNTRPLIDEIVADLKQLTPGEDVPLVDAIISQDGIHTALHKRNVSKIPLSDPGLTPLEFISYAVQDTRYPAIATFVLVREMSSRSRRAECHAYLCDSSRQAQRVAHSLALAFKLCAKKLEGKPYRFEVDLRGTDNERDDVCKMNREMTTAECDA